MMGVGYVLNFFSKLVAFFTGSNKKSDGLTLLVTEAEDFYKKHLYRRCDDCFNRPINSNPGAWIDVMHRTREKGEELFEVHEEKTSRCLNLGSYNYLGFGDPNGPTVEQVCKSVDQFSVASCSSRVHLGTTSLHKKVENTVAKFLKKEDCMIFGMGFATNSTGIPVLVGKGGLIISDSMNHASIVVGARTSGAKIKVFKHNDVEDLEYVVRDAIVQGQPRTHLPWTKILILVEGIYSMEGEMSPLDKIVEIKKKYGCYLMIDEAHSIGAIGGSGRGITEVYNVDTKDVDIMMGTFTKSFGAVGGYMAGTKDLIRFFRKDSAGSVYSQSISAPACQQILSAFDIIEGNDGSNYGQQKITQLKQNSIYFREQLIKMGFHVLGDDGSPVVPIMLYNPAKMAFFSRECRKRNLAVVVVGFPATSLLECRARFCISAGHTRQDLEEALQQLSEIGDLVRVKYGKQFLP